MMVKKPYTKQISLYFRIIVFIWTVLVGLFVIENASSYKVMMSFSILWLIGCIGFIAGSYLIRKWYTKLKQAESDNIESTKRFKRLAKIAFEGVVIHDNGIALDVNDSLCKMMGYSIEELKGVDLVDKFIPVEYKQIVKDNLGLDYIEPFELELIKKNGTRFFAEIEGKFENYDGRNIKVTSVKNIDKRKQAVTELQIAQQKLELHINSTPIAVLEWDVNFNVTRWNKAAEQIFGYKTDEVIGTHFSFILTEDVRELANDIFAGLLTQKGGDRNINENLTKDGAIITCEWYNTPLKDGNGEVIGVASLVKDITAHKKAEEALVLKNHELEAADEEVRAANEELVTTNDELKIKMYELQAAEEEIRASNEELVATNNALKNTMHELEAAEEEVRASLEEVQHKNDSLLLKEKELEVSNKMLQLVIDHIPSRVFWKDIDSNYLGCNRNFALDADCTNTNEVIGKTDSDLYDNALARKYRLLDFEVMNTGIAKLNVEETEEENGLKVFNTNRTPIRDDQNNVIGILGTYEDVTELKEIQQELVSAKNKAEESDKLKSSFLANMSHEVRTPMNGIIGFSQLLALKTEIDDKTIEYIDIIVSSGRQLLSIVDDILNISKIETGQVPLFKKEVNANELLKTMHPVFEIKAQSNQNEIKLHLNSLSNHKTLFTDATRLRQVISNLLTNALKFTSNGIVEYGYTEIDSCLQFYVKDNGVGISKEKVAIIFDRFMQLGESSLQNQGGVGLGLSICKGLVELMGGNIWVESEEGVGSVFYFTIPINENIEISIEDIKLDNESDISNFNLSGKTILVAEDDTTNHQVIEHMLLDSKVTLVKAMHGKDAIEKFKENKNIDLILMDIKMPVMNGIDAAMEIKVLDPNIPIIAQTAFALEENKEEFFDSRFDNYLTKPLNRVVLLNAIYKAVNLTK